MTHRTERETPAAGQLSLFSRAATAPTVPARHSGDLDHENPDREAWPERYYRPEQDQGGEP